MVWQVSSGNDLVASGTVRPLGTPRTTGTFTWLVFPRRTYGPQDCTTPRLSGYPMDEDDRSQFGRGSFQDRQLPHLATASSDLSHGTTPTGRHGYRTFPSFDWWDCRVYAWLCPPIFPPRSHHLCPPRLHSRTGNAFCRNHHQSALRTGLLAVGSESCWSPYANGHAGT